MEFIDEIRQLLAESGKTFEEKICGEITAFSESGGSFSVIAVPITETSPGAAERKSLVVKEFAATVPNPAIIAEDTWISRGIAVKARLKAHLGMFARIYARNCEVRRIDKVTAAGFLSENHSYGDASCRYRYGLYTRRVTGGAEKKLAPGTLVAVAEFSSARHLEIGGRTVASYEWVRYASKSWIRVNGGMGKMLQAFIDDVHPDDVMSYADLEWSEGGVYKSLGFVDEGLREPVTFAIDPIFWERTPLSRAADSAPLYYRNQGSVKYRLTLRG